MRSGCLVFRLVCHLGDDRPDCSLGTGLDRVKIDDDDGEPVEVAEEEPAAYIQAKMAWSTSGTGATPEESPARRCTERTWIPKISVERSRECL